MKKAKRIIKIYDWVRIIIFIALSVLIGIGLMCACLSDDTTPRSEQMKQKQI